MIRALYAAATRAFAPSVLMLLTIRRARGKEDPVRLPERLGRAGLPRPEGPLVWLHGASVGESLSALPLIDRLLAEDETRTVLITTGTVTSAKLMAERLPERAIHQFVPVDLPAAVERFLDHWRPDLALWLESELWPNMIRAASKRGIPLVLVNARLSARSFKRWRLLPGFARSLLGAFKLCLAQSPADADRFAALGAASAQSVGNLKYASPPLPADDTALETLRSAIGKRPVWLAASTHPGEEAIVAEAHDKLRARHPALLTLVVPRHPERGEAVAGELSSGGRIVARRGADARITAETGIYLADTLGELGLFYRLAPIAFVGGSLVPHGGQNLLEPAQLDCAILHGSNIFNFETIAEAMKSARATERVFDAGSLAAAVDTLLTDQDLRKRRAEAAATVAAGEAGVLDRIMAALAPYLRKPPAGAAPAQPLKEERRARA